MAWVLTHKVTIWDPKNPGTVYDVSRAVNHVKVESSWQMLEDKATVKLGDLKGQLGSIIKAGFEIKIELGYQGVYEGVEFEGYIKRVKPTVPMELECEDSLYLLRKKNISKAWKQTNLKELVRFIVAGTGIEVSGKLPEVNFEKFRLDNVNGADALNKLKEEYGLVAYFRGKQLFVGLAYSENPGAVKYNFHQNIPFDGMDLTYRTEEEIKIKVVAKSILKDNTQIEVEAGDKDGEQRTIIRYNIKDKKQLKQLAEDELKKFKFEGYEGKLTTFLVPYATHLMTATIEDPEFPERSGKYILDKVTTTYGTEGARRIIEPGLKIE